MKKSSKKTVIILIFVVLILAVSGVVIYFTLGNKALYPVFYFLDGNGKEYRIENVQAVENSPLENRQIIFLGSSVTDGYGSCGFSFVEYLEAKHGIIPTKEAVSGTTLVTQDKKSYIPRMESIDKNIKADAFVCQLSTNDATKGLPIGSVSDSFNADDFDQSTIAGAMEYIIWYAKETWNCPVIFYTGTKYDSSEYDNMVKLLWELEEKWDIGVIDLWNNQELNEISDDMRKLYMLDDIHPKMAGYLQWWLPEFEKVLIEEIG